MSAQDGDLLPAAPYIGYDAQGKPCITGSKCGDCDAVLLGARAVCPRCAARDKMQSVSLGKTGKLYNYTIVHRSLPGVTVPFVSAIVDLDGGGNIKGNLVGVADSDIRFDMPVKLVFDKAKQTDAKGRSYLTYYFVAA